MTDYKEKKIKDCLQCHNRGWYYGVRKNPYIQDYVKAPQEKLTPLSEPTLIKVCIVCVKCDSFNKRGLRAQKEVEQNDESVNYPYRLKKYPL
jgi:hypothetical protein